MNKKLQRWLEEANLLIFDMDGTVYEDTAHFDYYAAQLQLQLPAEKQEAFAAEYEKIKEGNHAVNVGMAYDVKRDAVITVDPMTLKAKSVNDWHGTKWSRKDIEEIYPGTLHFDFETLIAIGDGWWLPQVAARHFGATTEQTFESYNHTKAFMVTDEFQLTKTPGLKDALIRLGDQKHVVLVTNSDQDDVNRLLKELDLEGIFEEIVPSAQKPLKSKEHLQALLEKYETEPDKTVSFGDNFINEIAPSLKLDIKTVYIQANPIENINSENLITVRSLADVFSTSH